MVVMWRASCSEALPKMVVRTNWKESSMTEHLVQGPLRTAGLRWLGVGVSAALAVAALAACAPPGSGSPAPSEAAPTSVSTDLGSEPIELTLYDGAGLKTIDEALISA